MVSIHLAVVKRSCEFSAMLDLSDVTIIYLTTPTSAAPLMTLPLISLCMMYISRSLIDRKASIHPEPTPSLLPPPTRLSTHSSLFEYAPVSSRVLPWSCRAWLASPPSKYAHVVSRPWPCGSAKRPVKPKMCEDFRDDDSHAQPVLACA